MKKRKLMPEMENIINETDKFFKFAEKFIETKKKEVNNVVNQWNIIRPRTEIRLRNR